MAGSTTRPFARTNGTPALSGRGCATCLLLGRLRSESVGSILAGSPQRLWVSLPTSIKNHPDSGPIKIHPVSINKLHQTCSKISWNSGAPAGKDYMAFIFNLFEKNPQAHGLGLEMTWASINITFGKRREDEDNVLSYVS